MVTASVTAPLISQGSGAVAVVCLVVGMALIVGGAAHGIVLSSRQSRLAQVKVELEEAQRRFQDTRRRLEGLSGVVPESGGGGVLEGAGTELRAAAADAESTAGAAKSAVEQLGGAVGSLPEYLRFSGLLLLVGTVLVSVATIQFGGTSLF